MFRRKLSFGSRSCVLPSPALIYCPRVATEMRAVDVLPGSHLFFFNPLRAAGSALVAGEASLARLPSVAAAVAAERP